MYTHFEGLAEVSKDWDFKQQCFTVFAHTMNRIIVNTVVEMTTPSL